VHRVLREETPRERERGREREGGDFGESASRKGIDVSPTAAGSEESIVIREGIEKGRKQRELVEWMSREERENLSGKIVGGECESEIT
jgi:uncharacterized protein YheU (UPF0270 family)